MTEGIAVVFEQFSSDTSSVLVGQPDGTRVIGINANHSPNRRRFSLAHELGHACLHFPDEPSAAGDAVVDRPLEVLFRDGLASTGTSKIEIEANRFAADLLMPIAMVKQAFDISVQRNRPWNVATLIEDLAEQFDVSGQAMNIRLVNAHLDDPA